VDYVQVIKQSFQGLFVGDPISPFAEVGYEVFSYFPRGILADVGIKAFPFPNRFKRYEPNRK
jgi:hypothetical protein